MVVTPDVVPPSACSGSGRFVRPASATTNPPRHPAQLHSVGSAMLRPLRYVRPACPANVPRRAGNRPRAARQLPINRCRPQAEKARRPPAKLAFRPRRQKQGPLRGAFHWGVPQAPASMPRLKKPGHLPRAPQPPAGRPLLPHKAGSAGCPLGAAAPNPSQKAFRLVWSAAPIFPAPAPSS